MAEERRLAAQAEERRIAAEAEEQRLAALAEERRTAAEDRQQVQQIVAARLHVAFIIAILISVKTSIFASAEMTITI